MNVKKVEHGQPMSLKERVHFLDIVRGFALMGIILVNYFLIVDSVKGFEMESNDGFHHIVNWFASGKFITLFSFLFGVGFMIFMDRAAQKVDSPNKLFARRLTILLGIGLLHVTFVWIGDILTYYAVAGFLLLFFYKRTAKTIQYWLITLFAIQLLTPLFTMLLNTISTGSSGKPDFADFELTSHNSLTYLASIGDRWTDMVTMASSSFSTVYSMFFMFLLGVYFVKMSFFKNMETKKAIWNRIWMICTIAFLITLASTIMTAVNSFEHTPWMNIVSALEQNGGLTGSMFYMSSLAMLFLHIPQLRGALMVFTKVGRMSLSCYLLHSIIGTMLFLKYGAGLADHLSPAGTFFMAIGVYAFLVLFSTLWLKRFKSGPMEFIWRQLTYGKVNDQSKTNTFTAVK